MKAVRIKTRMTSETLTVRSPDLAELVGKDVEVIVIEEPSGATPPEQGSGYGHMRGTVLRYDDPFGPATAPEDWEAVG